MNDLQSLLGVERLLGEVVWVVYVGVLLQSFEFNASFWLTGIRS